MKYSVHDSVIELVQGDITEMETDAIVNAANAQLQLGGGVAGAIRSKGGPAIQQECNAHDPIKVGEAAITGAGNLKAKHVIHAVGPMMGEGDEDNKLRNATLNSLKLADEKGLKSISFPAISTGIFGYPIDRCANIMLTTAMEYLPKSAGLERAVFCLYGAESFNIFVDEMKRLFG
jgi:O-acetyl-ADP-ribose deacetylase (regulator of RNase III)